MSSTEEPRYIRFEVLPRKPRSTNQLTGERLAAVSVYEGRTREGRGFVIDTSRINSEQGLPALLAFAACDRPAYFVEGEEIGRGPDGEPLVRVESARPVPKTVDVTCIEGYAQNALRMWSKGPRDGSGTMFLRWRLGDNDSPYRPDNVTFCGGLIENPQAFAGRRKKKAGDKKRQKAQRKARKERKKNRR